MGTTAESVHVFIGHDLTSTETLRRIRADFISAAEQQSLRPTEDPAEARDSIALGLSGARWAGAVDSRFGTSAETAQRLSAANVAAVSMFVYDSDDVYVSLFERGKLADRFEYSGGKLKHKGKPEKWAAYLPDGNPATLRAAFTPDGSIFAETLLTRIAAALGIESDWCISPADELPQDGLTYLNLASTSPKSTPRPLGPPQFAPTVGGSSLASERTIGAGLVNAPFAHFTVENTGIAMRGLRVEVGGSALDEGLLEISTIHPIGSGPRVQPIRVESGTRAVTFEDLEIAEAVPPAERPEDAMLQDQKRTETRPFVTTQVAGTTLRTGTGILTIRVVPLANPAGAITHEMRATVVSQGFIPRKADATQAGLTEHRRALDDPRYLHALVALNLAQPDLGDIARDAVEAWIRFLSPAAAGRQWQISSAAKPFELARQFEIAGDDLKSPRWKKFRPKFSELRNVSGKLCAEQDQARGKIPLAAFEFDVAHLKLVPFLEFVLDTQAFGEQLAAEAQIFLTGHIDEIFAKGLGIQAVLGRWDSPSCSPALTTYERAAGVNGQFSRNPMWNRKYLRALGDSVWMGPELLSSLGEPPSLGTVAIEKTLGESARFDRSSETSPADFEAALDPVLPGPREESLLLNESVAALSKHLQTKAETPRTPETRPGPGAPQ